MNLCILAPNEFVEEVRDVASKNLDIRGKILSIPVSENGTLPATHWFCSFNVSEKMRDKLLSLQNRTIMEISDPKLFLKRNNLKIIL